MKSSRFLKRRRRLPANCLICRKAEPPMFWWPELEVPGVGKVQNLVMLGDEPGCEWFLLEFPHGTLPANPAAMRLRTRRIEVRNANFQGEETISDYVRRKARDFAT